MSTLALIVHCSADGPAGSSAPIDGSATFTTVESSMTINWATPTTPIGVQGAVPAVVPSPPRTFVTSGCPAYASPRA
ncbi:hypothetical protein SSP24_34980 [Streptomyces spinoverrucosus]|uniref:Uncharacterized protein n=1 Tax=Streptomyces spinoverrucosus TaxID=284043 RepID=A0A4Y3VH84_9ACTN|nr:hypothetical protein SSP24_34980 [Streptomyces spinoverrucosus]GHB82321.1 hypothetical protein GCM10010397_61710 [Streptomyces spinoverrucosus]